MSDGLDNISIAKIKQINFSDVKVYGDELAMSNMFDHISLFSNPCRIDGVVMFLCTSGELDCNVDMRPYHLTAGDMFINFNSSTIQARPRTSFRAMAALVSYTYLDKLHVDLGQKLTFYMGVKSNAVVHLCDTDIDQFSSLFKLMDANVTDYRPGQDGIMDALIQMLGRMMIRAAQTNPKEQTTSQRKPLRSEQIFERFMELVAKYHGAKRSTTFFAEEMGLTPNYLSSMVKTCSGRSASEWINEYTVTEAKLRLRFSDISVQEISSILGFPSQSAFGKFFKQHVGMNPNLFRREAR